MEIEKRLRISLEDLNQEDIDMLVTIRKMMSREVYWTEFTAVVSERVRDRILNIKDAMEEIKHVLVSDLGKDIENSNKYLLKFTNTIR